MSLLIIKTKNKKVTWHGVHQPEADLIAYNNDLLVIKVPGHSYWVGRCMAREYAPTEFQVFSVQSAITDSNTLEISVTAAKLLSFPARQKEALEQSADLAMKNLFNLVNLSSEKSESSVSYDGETDAPMFIKE